MCIFVISCIFLIKESPLLKSFMFEEVQLINIFKNLWKKIYW
jgi:hypothetical protein